MCTRRLVKGLSYFIRDGSEVFTFTCTMDITKAFDVVRHTVLFGKLMNQKFSAIFIRLLLRMVLHICYKYANVCWNGNRSRHFANVCWNGNRSRHFAMNNGVKQGAVLSAIPYCI